MNAAEVEIIVQRVRQEMERDRKEAEEKLSKLNKEKQIFYVIDPYVESLKKGNIAFNAPEKLPLDQTAIIELRLSPSASVEQLKNRIREGGKKEGEPVRITDRMEAQLAGQGFTIKSITPDEQSVKSAEDTVWQWEIKPTDTGQQRLHLAINAVFAVDSKDRRVLIRVFDATIKVNASPIRLVGKFIADNWAWIWAAIFVPVVVYLNSKWEARKEHKASGVRAAQAIVAIKNANANELGYAIRAAIEDMPGGGQDALECLMKDRPNRERGRVAQILVNALEGNKDACTAVSKMAAGTEFGKRLVKRLPDI